MLSFDPLYLVYGAFALLPAIIWLSFIFRKQGHKTFQILIFLLGASSVIPIFLIQILFQHFPQINIIAWGDITFANHPIYHFLFLYAWVAITEELVKQSMIRYLDSRYLLVETINDSIQLSLISALGFSFAENIFYFHQIGTSFGLAALLITFLFRSIFTTCGHLVFSGFFGYFYGRAKFTISLADQSLLEGKKFWFSRMIGKMLNISKFQAFQETTILQGLMIAIVTHASFNFLLEMSNYTGNSLFIAAAAILILALYILLRWILRFKAGSLILTNDNQGKKLSTMAQDDETVVMELLGMWFNSGKFVDVIHVCERLLKRDPDNKIVQLFKARAMDKLDHASPYRAILSKMFPDKQK